MSRIVYCFCYSDFIFISFIFASIIIRIMYFFLLFISSSGLRVMSNEDEEESLASSSFSTRCSLGPHEMDTSLSIRFPNQVRWRDHIPSFCDVRWSTCCDGVHGGAAQAVVKQIVELHSFSRFLFNFMHCDWILGQSQWGFMSLFSSRAYFINSADMFYLHKTHSSRMKLLSSLFIHFMQCQRI